MGHYAFLDENNIVIDVITGKDENELIDGLTPEVYYGILRNQKCKRTSYNTQEGRHNLGGTPFRKNYASVGYYYDEELDAFISPQPFPSWILNEEEGCYHPPTPKPTLGFWQWNEDNLSWESHDI